VSHKVKQAEIKLAFKSEAFYSKRID